MNYKTIFNATVEVYLPFISPWALQDISTTLSAPFFIVARRQTSSGLVDR